MILAINRNTYNNNNNKEDLNQMFKEAYKKYIKIVQDFQIFLKIFLSEL